MRAHGDLLAPTAKFSSSQRFYDKPDTGGGTVMRSHEDLNAKSKIKFSAEFAGLRKYAGT
eukprot:599848-Amorphochlora_amoeboformis.AAC.1